MLTRVYIRVALGAFALFLSACGNRAEKENGAPAGTKTPAAAGVQTVTFYVEGMTERQGIT